MFLSPIMEDEKRYLDTIDISVNKKGKIQYKVIKGEKRPKKNKKVKKEFIDIDGRLNDIVSGNVLTNVVPNNNMYTIDEEGNEVPLNSSLYENEVDYSEWDGQYYGDIDPNEF